MGRKRLKADERTVRVGFSIQESLWQEFVALAEKKNTTYSFLLRELLENQLRPSGFSWAKGETWAGQTEEFWQPKKKFMQ